MSREFYEFCKVALKIPKLFKKRLAKVKDVTAKTEQAVEKGEKALKETGLATDTAKIDKELAALKEQLGKTGALKRAFHEGWGMGGEWTTYQGEPEADGSPLMHDRGVPYDVQWKSERRDFFHDKQRAMDEESGETPREPQEGGKIVPGRLGKYYGTGR